MNRAFPRRRSITLVILLTLFLLVPAIGCTSGVSNEEYDKAKSELAQVTNELREVKEQIDTLQKGTAVSKETLHTAQESWHNLAPELEIFLNIWENASDYGLWQDNKITQEEYYRRTKNLWAETEICLIKIGDDELTEKLTAAWHEPMGTARKQPLFVEFYDLHLNLINKDIEQMSQNLGQ
jgi:hypothetical protein